LTEVRADKDNRQTDRCPIYGQSADGRAGMSEPWGLSERASTALGERESTGMRGTSK